MAEPKVWKLEPAVCAYCHGVRLDGPTAWIHSTRFAAGSTGDGAEVRYDFCDDGCKKLWLNRAEPARIDGCQLPEGNSSSSKLGGAE